MACVPGGPFTRGVDHDKYRKCFQFDRVKTGYSDAEPAATVEVSTFFMDRHEVTVADFNACKKAGVCRKHAGPHYKGMDDPKMPILAVTWYDAKQYCEWRGKRLPTEAEWEKAARGPRGDIYPWGNDVATCEHAIIREHGKTSCGRRKPIDKPTTGRPFAWGSRPAGHYGLYDMVGNAEEWVADWYSLNWRRCGKDCLGRDPKGPCGGADKCPGHKYKVVRGGSWFWPKCANTGYHRRPHVPRNRPLHHFGFRCAASLEQAHALAAKEGKVQPAAKPAVVKPAAASGEAPKPSPGGEKAQTPGAAPEAKGAPTAGK